MNGRQPRPSKDLVSRDSGVNHESEDEIQSDAIPSETVLSLLGDTYARRILLLLVERPRTGRELTTATDMSRPTVYRRLERLREAGLVGSELQLDPDGHHRNRFHATVNGFEFDIGPSGIESRVRPPADDRTKLGGSITNECIE